METKNKELERILEEARVHAARGLPDGVLSTFKRAITKIPYDIQHEIELTAYRNAITNGLYATTYRIREGCIHHALDSLGKVMEYLCLAGINNMPQETLEYFEKTTKKVLQVMALCKTQPGLLESPAVVLAETLRSQGISARS